MRADAAATIFSRSNAPPPPLIGSVDGQVEFRRLFQCRLGYAEFAAKYGRSFRCRHTDDDKPRRHLLGQQPHEGFGGRACADAEPHAIAHLGKCGAGSLEFQLRGIHAFDGLKTGAKTVMGLVTSLRRGSKAPVRFSRGLTSSACLKGC
jgi:hypothetical protein